jgi:hypothetical protein
MMFPLIGVPETIAKGMNAYRGVFCRQEGFEHVSRYISGLLLSENKTVQGFTPNKYILKEKGRHAEQCTPPCLKQGGIVRN